MVSGTRMFAVDPSGPVCLGAGASMDRTCSSMSHRGLIKLGSGEFGLLVVSLELFLKSFCGGFIVLLWVALPSGSTIAMGECTWSCTRVKWTPKFPSRTLHCNEMTDVIHITCQWC